MHILHRDIKCANIFLTKDRSQVKLADMNVSIVSSSGMARTQTGTPYSPKTPKPQEFDLLTHNSVKNNRKSMLLTY